MLFSVVIPTYNRASLLSETLESVWRQTFTDFEVIVVDDGSSDKTLEYLASLGNKVCVLTQKNLGPGAARNRGAKEAVGDYLAFLDSDDVWFPWTLATFVEVITKCGWPDFISAKMQLFVSDSELNSVRQEPLAVETLPNYYEASDSRYYVSANMMVVRKSAFQNVDGFIDKKIYAEDCDLSLRLGLAKGFVQILSPVTLGYRQHPTSARHDHRLILEGIGNLIESEQCGRYPGGQARELDRLRLITLHSRPASIDSLRGRRQKQGWRLYWKTFRWHLKMARWKYLLGFPLMAMVCALGFRRVEQ